MQFVLVGVSHKSAPVDIRDRLAFSRDESAQAILNLIKHDRISECLVLSTCNRTELLVVFNDQNRDAADFLVQFFAESRSFETEELNQYAYVYFDEDAIEHLFSVCSGLDSLALGETQIVSQIKDAYELCCTEHANGPFLNRLLHRSFGVSKRVRSATRIGQGSMSVSFVACDLAKQAFGDLNGKNAILVGAGEMGHLTARNLRKRGIENIHITSRSLDKAEKLAKEFGGKTFPGDELCDYMAQTDIVIAATSSPEYVLTEEIVGKAAQNRESEMVLIDLGVPRDIDPAAGNFENVLLYNIDDLDEIAESNRQQRSGELEKCREIINGEVACFKEWLQSYKATPIIAELQHHFEQIRANEIDRLGDKLSHDDFTAVETATRELMRKILRHPIVHLVEAAKEEHPVENMKSVCCVLGVHDE